MKILLATGGSEWSEAAARFLARFDFTPAVEITVLHVVPGAPFHRAGKPCNPWQSQRESNPFLALRGLFWR